MVRVKSKFIDFEKKTSNGLFGVLILKQKYIVLLLILVGKSNNDISEIRIPLLE